MILYQRLYNMNVSDRSPFPERCLAFYGLKNVTKVMRNDRATLKTRVFAEFLMAKL
jgi:hypothetical protein